MNTLFNIVIKITFTIMVLLMHLCIAMLWYTSPDAEGIEQLLIYVATGGITVAALCTWPMVWDMYFGD